MQLIRSWPAQPPEGRARVVDDARRLLNSNYDYRGLVDFDDDILHIDWDTAVSREDVEAFARRARRDPGSVLVAPVPVYADSRRGLDHTVWNLRRYEDGGQALRYVQTGEPSCHLFGFGMLYLPRVLIRGFVDAFKDRLEAGAMVFDDSGFAGWHHQNVSAETPVAWEVRPVHLHYRISDVPL